MKRIFVLVLFFYCSIFFAQNVPSIKLENGVIFVKKLKVNVEIIGDIAITTYDMSFYNSRNRILEGELNFPLGENQSVTKFALDINGNLREAVVVEKEKARVAFETTVRDRIDPALLEQTKGNNYKARIYPIPARGYKRVVLSYQQKLILNNDNYYYKIPFDFKKKLDNFSLSVKVLNQKNKPIISHGLLNDFKFNSKKNTFTAKIHRKRYKVKKPVLIKIPLNSSNSKLIEYNNYFYYTTLIDERKQIRFLDKEVTIFWDNSLSQKDKKNQSEIEFLGSYFNKNKNVKVNFVTFNIVNKSKTIFNIKNGNWNALKDKISSIIYDGATSYDFFRTYQDKASLRFIFTNGLNTISKIKQNFNTTTHIINSKTSANHSLLKFIANNSGGRYINLQQISIKDAIDKIEKTPIQILGTNFSKDEIEIFPKVGSIVSNNISISGKNNSKKSSIKVFLGRKKDTLFVINFELGIKGYKTSVVKQLWAQKKINDLVLESKENERKIVKISKEYNVISPFTSLLVLDRVEDYVRYEIKPPFELQKRYYKLLSEKHNDKKERLLSIKSDLNLEYESFFNWFNNANKQKKKKKPVTNNNITVIENSFVIDTISSSNLDENEFVISGNVRDENGVLPGVSVIVKGTSRGTETDFDGNFSLIISRGNELSFSYLGFKTTTYIPRTSNNIRVVLEEDDSVLEEVVVTGLAVSRTNSKLGYSTSFISSKSNNINQTKIDLKGWDPKTPYLKILNKIKNLDIAYKEYLKLRVKYGDSPSFYIDVADFFMKKNEKSIAKLILSNLAEIDLSNYELLKALAYKLEEYNLWDNAIFIYKEILRLRPEDVQSYRDLALAYEYANEYQKSFDLLYRIVKGEFLEKDLSRRYKGVEVIALHELNRLIDKYDEDIDFSYMNNRYRVSSKVDIRVVIDWNHNDTDIDLWVYEPNGEKCFYSNKRTKIGGLMSNDMTRGFGPEQYVLKKALKGKYNIELNYYGDTKQKVSGPTFLKVTTFTNYGKKNEIIKKKLIRLSGDKDEIDLGSILIK